MQRSRVQKGKSKKSQFQMLAAVLVILVVVVAGYVIVRYSQASTRFNIRTIQLGNLKGGVNTINKEGARTQAREVGNVPVYATFNSAEIGKMNKACATIFATENTTVSLELQGAYFPGKILSSKPSTFFRAPSGGWHEVCVGITKDYIDQMNFIAWTSTPVTSTLKISEAHPEIKTSYASVAIMYLTNN